MKVIIAGAGSVGRFMARQLSASGHEVTIIEQSKGVVSRHDDTEDFVWITGDACEIETLSSAGASDADVLAAVTGDDEDNLVVSLLAKQEFAVPRVLARVNHPKNEWMFNEMWGVDISVSTPHLLTSLVEEAVNIGQLVTLLSLEQGKTRLCEVTLAASSPAIGLALSGLGLPREAAVVAVVRDGHVVVPDAELVLHEMDEVVVLVASEFESDVRGVLVG